MAARFEVTKKYAAAYAAAPKKGKSQILDQVVEVWILRSGRAGVPLCGEPVFRAALSHGDGPGWTVGCWGPTAGRPPTCGHSSWVKCLRMESSQLRTVACALVVIRSTMASARIFSSIRSCH